MFGRCADTAWPCGDCSLHYSERLKRGSTCSSSLTRFTRDSAGATKTRRATSANFATNWNKSPSRPMRPVLYAAHFSKGNQAGKEAIDRIGGSGVWTRDADSIVTLTKHQVEGAFTVDLILRNLPEQSPFVVKWGFPLMKVAPELDPDELKQAVGRKRAHDPRRLLAAIADTTAENPISISAWAAAGNIKRQTLADYLPEMRSKGWIATTGEGNAARQYLTKKGEKSCAREPDGNYFRQFPAGALYPLCLAAGYT